MRKKSRIINKNFLKKGKEPKDMSRIKGGDAL